MFNSFKRILHVQYWLFPPEFCSWTEMNLKRYLNHLKKAGQTKAKIIFGVFKALLGSDPPHLFSGKKCFLGMLAAWLEGRK